MFKRLVSLFMALIIFTFVLIPPDSVKGAAVAVGAELGTQLIGVVLGALGVEALTTEEVLELAVDVYENSPARPILDTMAVVASPELADQYIEAYADDFEALFDTVKDYVVGKFYFGSDSSSFSNVDTSLPAGTGYLDVGGLSVSAYPYSSWGSASVWTYESTIGSSFSLPVTIGSSILNYRFSTPSNLQIYKVVDGVEKVVSGTSFASAPASGTFKSYLFFAYNYWGVVCPAFAYSYYTSEGKLVTGREVSLGVLSDYYASASEVEPVSYPLSSSNAFANEEYISDVFENLNNSSDYVDEDKKTILKVPDVLPDSIDLTIDLSDVFERPLAVVEPTAMPTEMPTAMPTEIPDIVVPPVEDLDGVFGWLGGFFNNLLTLLQNALLWFAQVLVGSGEINLDKFKLNAQALAQTYPLSIPFDLLNCFKLLVAEPKAPVFVYDFTEAFSSYLSTPIVLSVNMGDGLFAPVYKVFRWFEFAAFVVSLISVTRNLVRG